MWRGKNKFYFNIALFSPLILCLSCSKNTNNNVYQVKLPEIENVVQTLSNDINVLVNTKCEANFKTSIHLKQDVSAYSTNVQESNPYMFVKDISGENIDDVLVKSIQYNCLMADSNFTNFACTFNFNITAKDNWQKKNIVRKIDSITYSIFDTEIVSPVSINIYEGFENVDTINDCPIFRNTRLYNHYSTRIKNEKDSYALNWNYKGFGSEEPDINKVIHIKSIFFHFDLMKVDKASLIFNSVLGTSIDPPREDELNIPDNDYQISSEQVYWADNWFQFIISINTNKTEYKQVADFLEMEYSVNDSTENKYVILSSVQLCEFYNLY